MTEQVRLLEVPVLEGVRAGDSVKARMSRYPVLELLLGLSLQLGRMRIVGCFCLAEQMVCVEQKLVNRAKSVLCDKRTKN